MSLFFDYVASDTIMYCGEHSCGGLVKPDIIFFDESIVSETSHRLSAINTADLVIVMGSSLKVNPVSYTMEHLPNNIPVLVMDVVLPEILVSRKTNNLVFVEGQIEHSVKCIAEDFGWSSFASNRIVSNTFNTDFAQYSNNTDNVVLPSDCTEAAVVDKMVSFCNFRNIVDDASVIDLTLDWSTVRSLFLLQVKNMGLFAVC